MMTTYRITDDASQSTDDVQATSAGDALFRWLGGGYRTDNGDGEHVAADAIFSRVQVWADDDSCAIDARVIADGLGGIQDVRIVERVTC